MITRTTSKPLGPFISTCLRQSSSSSRHRPLLQARALHSSITKACLFQRQPPRSPSLVANLGQTRHFSSELKFGQPVHETHPHLLKAGEVTPGITAFEYHLRRSRLAALLKPSEAALIASSSITYRSGPVFNAFHQDSDFHYLTGFLEPSSLALIEKAGEEDYRFTLFCLPKDPHKELWDGPRNGLDAATEIFNADAAHPIHDITHLTHRLRAFKSPAELTLMRRAATISSSAFNSAISSPTPFPSEHALHAHLTHHMLTHGCEREAYIPVVAGGPNGLSIHYTVNNALLRPSDLVLVDAGGQYGGYITDITRTWPVSGRFTNPQRAIYEIVLAANKRGIELCTEAAQNSLDQIHHACAAVLRDGLRDLGLDVSGDAMETLFPHHVGHYVGLDVHDVGTWSRALRLTEGQVVTVEPGLYFPGGDERWPVEYRGLAVRVEDCVLVGKERAEVLTGGAWKEVRELEVERK
ncbi:hypothetical protein BJ508DRAFT_370945 [Ascobolus immersus RN42]|uniref:Xaa-Pro aminopeptidase n=1 Tax=Ascobolus immersus RN42 TaxID=1160509 RepID=A0A3N4HM35_ASCIM|nr:hypothetical protein BJ508DRAFT_370945 [Ascobolus immersus RN42]